MALSPRRYPIVLCSRTNRGSGIGNRYTVSVRFAACGLPFWSGTDAGIPEHLAGRRAASTVSRARGPRTRSGRAPC